MNMCIYIICMKRERNISIDSYFKWPDCSCILYSGLLSYLYISALFYYSYWTHTSEIQNYEEKMNNVKMKFGWNLIVMFSKPGALSHGWSWMTFFQLFVWSLVCSRFVPFIPSANICCTPAMGQTLFLADFLKMN